MLPRKHRISTEEFEHIMEKGRVAHSPLFLVRILKKESADRISQFAAVVSHKVGKTAVIRSKNRRRIYSAIGHVLKDVAPDVQVLAFAKEKLISADMKAIVADLRALFVKAGLLK